MSELINILELRAMIIAGGGFLAGALAVFVTALLFGAGEDSIHRDHTARTQMANGDPPSHLRQPCRSRSNCERCHHEQ